MIGLNLPEPTSPAGFCRPRFIQGKSMRRIVYRLAGAFIYIGQILAIPNQSVTVPIDATGLPVFAQITLSGMPQVLPLDCEARSAVDWAAFLGVSIDELEFLGKLPVSDNPERGFVGSMHGARGKYHRIHNPST
jgi:hypothetical protein